LLISSIKYNPLGVSTILYLLVVPILDVIYLIPSTLPLFANSIGKPSDAFTYTLLLYNILNNPLF